MEDVLEVYTRPADPRRPLICLNEAGRELVADTRFAAAGQAEPPGKA